MNDLLDMSAISTTKCRTLIGILALVTSLIRPVSAALIVDSSNNTVTDSVTNLVWDRCILGRSDSDCQTDSKVPVTYSWQEALAASVSANSALHKGFSDWRLPNVKELESIVRLTSVDAGQPAIDNTAFPNTPTSGDEFGLGAAWSSTSYATDPSRAWIVLFSNGEYQPNLKQASYFVRLVRSGQPFASFDVLGTSNDISAPITIAGPAVSAGPTQTGADVSTTIDEAGIGYWLLVYSNSVAPSPAEVLAGGSYGSPQVNVVSSGNFSMSATVPSAVSLSGLTANTAYTFYFVAKDSSNNVQSIVTAATFTTTSNPTRLLNIATRGKVETVDNVMIAGFIIQGSSAKKVLIRARGPSLAVAPFNVPGTLADPFLTLYSGATPIDTNDDFAQHANAGQIPADWTPASAKEAAIVTTLSPGAYTAIVNGVGATSGVAIVEVFELDQPGTPLINIATRGPVQTGDNVMIAGLIIQGDAPKTVLITARGPSMAGPPHNVPGTLSDPVLTLFSGQTPIASNDNWPQAANAAQIQTAIGAPTNTLESAILITLQPGAYTAIVNGASNATGLGIVEVFAQ
jgi:hypothetical protein